MSDSEDSNPERSEKGPLDVSEDEEEETETVRPRIARRLDSDEEKSESEDEKGASNDDESKSGEVDSTPKDKKKEKESEDDKDDVDDDKEESADEKESNDEKEDGSEGDKAESEEEEEEEEEESQRSSQTRPDFISDFDLMMAKKKEENSRKRKRRGYDIINDNDDFIADIINQMKDAVEADNEANKNKQAATRKLKLLPFVISQLRKVDLRDAFLDSDVLSVITEWLAPLPDRSLPHLNIRESFLKILVDFNLYDVDKIKASGIGKAVMYLYKHPKEIKENKQIAKQLISCWSRPIFELDSNFSAISREEREQRDLELRQQRLGSRKSDAQRESDPEASGSTKRGKEEAGQKPGDKGWIPRARVPAPSMRDYVFRPKSKVDGDIGKNSRRPTNMLEKYMKSQQERKRASRQQRAVNMKIDKG